MRTYGPIQQASLPGTCAKVCFASIYETRREDCSPQLNFTRVSPCSYNVDLCYTPMTLADVFKSSNYARDSDFTTNESDNPVIIQFAANNSKDLAEAAELAAPYVNGIGPYVSLECSLH